MNADSSNTGANAGFSPADVAALAAGIADLTKAGLPLPDGLRALAEESPRTGLRKKLFDMADRIERGESLESVLNSGSKTLPPQLFGLLLAGIRTGRLPEMIEEFIQAEESRRNLRQRLRLSLAYPILLSSLTATLVVLISSQIALSFEKIFKDFDTQLPVITLAFMALLPYLQWITLGLAAFLFLLPLLASDAPGFAWLSPLLYRIPLLGSLLKYARWAIFSKFTALLMQQNLPLPEVLRLVAKSVSDPYLSRGCRRVAFEVENGRVLSDSMREKKCFPPSLIPFLVWGEKSTALPEAFSSADKMYADRAKSQTTSLMAIAVPFVLLSIIVFAGLTVIAIFMPLLSLITSLTSGPRHAMKAMQASNFDLLNAALLILAAGSLFILVNLILLRPLGSPKREPLKYLLKVFVWGATYWVAGGLLYFFVNAILGIVWLIAIPLLALFVELQSFRIRRRGLLRMLSLAVEKNIPLVPALDAYAEEVGGRFGDRVFDFSASLNNGVPLPDAIKMTPGLIPADLLPLICSGYESGDLAKGMREAAAPNSLETVWGSVSAKMLYIAGMICFLFFWLIFMFVKIFPAFEKIVRDYGTGLPAISLDLISMGRLMTHLIPLLIVVLFFFLFLFAYSLFKYYGIVFFELPGIDRLMRRKHSAEILENLAMAVENRRSIDAGLQTLVRLYPNGAIRRKLAQSLDDVRTGGFWLESLLRRGLIGQSDFAVLQAAESVGNLPWAMRETAFANRRRLAVRLNMLVQLLFPPVVICFGCIVLFVVLAAFMPLVHLI